MYRFSRSIWENLSAGTFREFAKERYPKIKKKELDELVARYYGETHEEIVEPDGFTEVEGEREEPFSQE
jgi:hypothetical protein